MADLSNVFHSQSSLSGFFQSRSVGHRISSRRSNTLLGLLGAVAGGVATVTQLMKMFQ